MDILQLQKNKWHGNISTLEGLRKYIKLTPAEEKELTKVINIHPMLISRYYISLINRRDRNDPIKKMIVPSREEMNVTGTYDTSGEYENTKMPGLQHKYPQTAFILTTNRCAAYCRYCFRKRLVGLPSSEIIRRFDKAVAYIKKHKEINNVLLSGGDPFMLPTKIIGKFLRRLSAIKHLDFIRFGTRTPVTFPYRITQDPALLKILKKYSMPGRRIYLVTHFNHPNEITSQSKKAINMLLAVNVRVFNQTVLLKGVNDNPEILIDLFSQIIKMDILPYYVFQCRPVKRVKHHFQVSLYQGVKIFERTKQSIRGHIICKRLKYIMAHRTGKIEILGTISDRIYFKYHHAKNPRNRGRLFSRKLDKKAGWLDDLKS